jgi:uncharacterized membrane protein (DUF4010 family)
VDTGEQRSVNQLEIFKALSLALALGLIVGIQRERSKRDIAGIRTFALITLFGAVLALLAKDAGIWVLAAGVIALAAILVTANVYSIKAGTDSAGVTTELAALTMFGIGAVLMFGYTMPAVVTGGVVALLLQWKEPMHRFAHSFNEGEARSIFQFVLLALVILPLLPNRPFGPYEVLNPFEIWLIVVLIVGISLAAYLAYRLFGARAGTLLGGILGGLISSTATAVSYSRQTRNQPDLAAMAAIVILIASAVVYARILFEIAVIAPGLLPHTLIPLSVMLGFMSALGIAMFWRVRNEPVPEQEQESPGQLKAALAFGALYAVILLLVAAVREHFGSGAIYGVALISGLTDVDAITLSSAQLFNSGRLEASTAWRVILLASLSNLVFKAGAVIVLGNRAVSLRVAIYFGLSIVLGAMLLLLPSDLVLRLP